MAKTFEELKALAIQIRDELTNKANTALRVGTSFLETIFKIEEEYYSKEDIKKLISDFNVSVIYPHNGYNSTERYTLSIAITQVWEELRSNAGLKVSFIGLDGETEVWAFQGGEWSIDNFIKVNICNYMILRWDSDEYITRLQVPMSERKSGLMISYFNTKKFVHESYISENFTDDEWIKSENWDVIQADISIGENGNWFIDGKDTGRPSRGEAGANLGDIILSQEFSTEPGSENKVISQKAISQKIDELLEGGLGAGTADKVLFTKDIVVTADIGVIRLNGAASKTLPTTNKSVQNVFEMLCSEEREPSVSQPYVNITSTAISSGGGSYEVGTSVTPDYRASLSPGNYQFGPATGVTATSWEISNSDGTSSSTEAEGSFPAIIVGDDTQYKITAKAHHTEGTVPVTNLGNERPEKRIQATTSTPKSKTLGTITGYRKMFYGFSTEQVGADGYNSALIRSLNGSKFSNNLNITVPPGKLEIIIACEATKANTLSIYSNTVFQNITATRLEATVDVEGANGYTAKAYNVWYVKLGTAYSSNQSWSLTFK